MFTRHVCQGLVILTASEGGVPSAVQVRKGMAERERPATVSCSEWEFASSVWFHPSVAVP